MSAKTLVKSGIKVAQAARASTTKARIRGGVRPLLVALLIAWCASLLPVLAQELDEDNLLLLDFNLDRLRLASSVTAYQFGNTAVVSLAEAAAALEFPISVDAERGTASGWFIRPTRLFALDFAARRVDFDGQSLSFSADEVFIYDGDILVTLETFSRWFPVDLDLDINRLTLTVTPREQLPVQARLDRRKGFTGYGGVGPATLPPIETPYRFIGPQAADVGVGYSIRRHRDSGRPSTGLSYSALVAGDLLFMDSRIYLSGSREDALSHARASLSRSDLDLPLGLRYIELGDIDPPSLPGLGARAVERGLLLQGGGSVIGRDDLIDGDLITVSGDALEGWDVELFQNGMRIGFQTVGADGRYDFRDIEPTGDENVFELVFYGPSGEERRETVTRYAGFSPDQPGSVRYQLSVSEQGRPLYDGDGFAKDKQADRGGARVAAGAEIRVLPQLAVRGGVNSVTVDGERLNYYSAGMRTGFRGLTLSVDALRDPQVDGTRWNGAVQLPASANLFGFNARFSHTQFARSERVEDAFETRLRSRTGATLTRSFGSTATRLAYVHNRGFDRRSNELELGFTHRFSPNTQFGHTLNYVNNDHRTAGTRDSDRLDGNLFFNMRARPLNVRGGVAYTLRPNAEARQYFIDSTLRVAEDMTMSFAITHRPESSFGRKFTRYSSGLNWALPQVMLSPRLTYDSDGHYAGFLYASFSLAPRPDRSGVLLSRRSLATSGAVASRVFIDHDGSGDFSVGDEPLPGVVVRAPQAGRHAETGSDGVALLTGVSNARPTDVKVDVVTLPRTDLVPAHAGNSVRPRPTAVTMIDFPVVPTGDIEGHVFELQQDGRAALSGATIELRDVRGELATVQISAFDGYFFFMEVPYGRYTVTLSGARGERLRAPAEVEVRRDNASVSGVELLVTQDPTNSAGTTSGPADVMPVAPTELPSMAGAELTTLALQPVGASVPATTNGSSVRTVAANPTNGQSEVARPAAGGSAAAQRATRPAVGSDGRVVQLGAFSERSRAQAQLDAVMARGLLKLDQVAILEPNGANRLHRIIASPNGSSARELCGTLSAQGVSCFTVAY